MLFDVALNSFYAALFYIWISEIRESKKVLSFPDYLGVAALNLNKARTFHFDISVNIIYRLLICVY